MKRLTNGQCILIPFLFPFCMYHLSHSIHGLPVAIKAAHWNSGSQLICIRRSNNVAQVRWNRTKTSVYTRISNNIYRNIYSIFLVNQLHCEFITLALFFNFKSVVNKSIEFFFQAGTQRRDITHLIFNEKYSKLLKKVHLNRIRLWTLLYTW